MRTLHLWLCGAGIVIALSAIRPIYRSLISIHPSPIPEVAHFEATVVMVLGLAAIAAVIGLWLARRRIWNGALNTAALGLRASRSIGNKASDVADEIDRRASKPRAR